MAKTNRLGNIKAKYATEAKVQESVLAAHQEDTSDDETSPLADLVSQIQVKYDSDKIYYGNPDEFQLYPNEKIRLKPHTGDKKELLRESIKQDGVLDPALVWMTNGEKIILAGQNRNIICKEENMQLPYIVKEIQDTRQADRIVVVTNLHNRQYNEMLPSELCSMLSCLIDSYDNDVYKGDIIKDISSEFKLERNQIYRVLSFRKLIPELLDLLDKKLMPMYAGYTLASVNKEKQTALYDFIQNNGIEKISKKNVDALMTRPEAPWELSFLQKAFGLETSEKKRSRKNIIIENAKIQPFLFEGELNKIQDTVVDAMNMRYQIHQKLKEHNIAYSEKEVLHAIDLYLTNK
ncbi:MAG: ParB N-terminal domain-containing protein [Lachnospiraceae bacterium]|nr:ParB N-terminal domain-containing protein [Lachnospiraceae bacterium]